MLTYRHSEGEKGRYILAMDVFAGSPKKTILLADDDDLVRALGERILKRGGYSVLTAKDGQEVLQIYKREQGKISLVILDLVMPKMGGDVCFDELLKLDPEVHVIIATGASTEAELKDEVKTRVKGLIQKPYDINLLLHTVRAALEED
jgi:DNA-binding NtrC family response regulator